MKKLFEVLATCFLSLAALQPALAQQGKPGIERLYVLYCGDIALNDASSFTPGASGPGVLAVTCYLVKHARGWLLWDTGLPDAIVNMPDGQKSPSGVWTSKKTLASQLAALGLKPSDINYVALSHQHGDHVGNLDLFPQSTLVVQKAEYEWVPPVGPRRFKPEQPAIKAEGDHDVFGDGSVVLISTPGHTPGHQCLLGAPAENRRAAAQRRCGAHQGQLGQPSGAAAQSQRAAIARLARSHGGRPQGEQRPALDRPRAE
jgi:hypothetical protein